MTEFKPSAYQQAFFDWVETGHGSAVLIAVAGSGKTTSIVQALTRIDERASVRMLAFNKTIGDELNARIAGRKNVRAGTFHSLCYGALLNRLKGVRMTVDGGKVRKLCRQFMTEADHELYADYVTKLVGYAKGQGIGALTPDLPAAWFDLIQHHDLFLDSEDASEERAIELAREAMTRSESAAREGLIDFDDQLYLVCKWRVRLFQNDWVFVDEAQDTNPVRRAVAKLALKPGGRLVAVGDPSQAIYGFTGASHDAIELIKREFNAIELPLTVSYRCARAIVAKAQTLVSHIEAFDGAPEGIVENVSLDNALKVLGDHDAILCRQTAPLIATAYALIAKGVGCAVLGREIGAGLINLIKKQKARSIDALMDKLETYRDREIAKFTAKGEEGKAEGVNDRVESIHAVINSLGEGERTVIKLIAKLEALFSDANGRLLLSTVHKAKGREWERVAILRPELMPSKWARQDWQQEQEKNVMYVAWTRAKSHLMFIEGGNSK